ncbi:hypothetical protein [Pseudooceanicola atlanticus]|uniref:hypothetical protein n=1 Tax=Pseudooceanicola atlanticus TaxID=1461694 RepID=UPI0023530B55|nr:hypothetical protein [Pseudooceanicola atlanticus]
MSDILARLQQAHEQRHMVEVQVPEYGDTWYFPPLTLADHEIIRKGIKPSDDHALMVSGLIHMARHKDGSRVFDVPKEDRPKLRAELHRMEVHVLQRIMVQSGGGLGQQASAELGAIDTEALEDLRGRLIEFAGEDAPILASAAKGADDTVLLRALTVLVEASEAEQSPKNG